MFGLLTDNPVEVLNEHLSLLVGRYGPTKVIRVRNKDKPWFDNQCRNASALKQEVYLRWTRDRFRVNNEEFFLCQVELMKLTQRSSVSFVTETDVLMDAQSPRKWWSTVSLLSSSLPPLVGGGGRLVCE